MRVLILKPKTESEFITKGLSNLGHDFLFAPTLEAARALLKEQDVDLIIAPSNLCGHEALNRPGRPGTTSNETSLLSTVGIKLNDHIREPTASLTG